VNAVALGVTSRTMYTTEASETPASRTFRSTNDRIA